MKTGIIYKATSPSGKSYIGLTTEKLRNRKWRHKSGSVNKKYGLYNTKFSRALRKYEIENFSWVILYKDIPRPLLNSMEMWIITQYDTYNNGYNSNMGGGTNFGYKPSKEAIEKSAAAKRGKPRSEETKRKISEALIGKSKPKMSDKTKKKISISKMGSKNPQYGKKETEEHKAARVKLIKQAWTPERKEKQSKNRAGENSPVAKLTWTKVKEIRAKHIPYKYSYNMLAKEYNVCRDTIISIIHKKTWKNQ